ncbi:MAG: hypothetical protein EP341_11455 [Sphingomonadales bacterium]|nr:MAG: hypothetical protein EP341_11455 [Sphingomonadales bacterium]
MSDRVVSIDGGPVIDGRDPNPDCVAELEDLLEMARSGEIVGIAGTIIHHDEGTSRITAGFCRSPRVVGSLAVLQQSFVMGILQDED